MRKSLIYPSIFLIFSINAYADCSEILSDSTGQLSKSSCILKSPGEWNDYSISVNDGDYTSSKFRNRLSLPAGQANNIPSRPSSLNIPDRYSVNIPENSIFNSVNNEATFLGLAKNSYNNSAIVSMLDVANFDFSGKANGIFNLTRNGDFLNEETEIPISVKLNTTQNSFIQGLVGSAQNYQVSNSGKIGFISVLGGGEEKVNQITNNKSGKIGLIYGSSLTGYFELMRITNDGLISTEDNITEPEDGVIYLKNYDDKPSDLDKKIARTQEIADFGKINENLNTINNNGKILSKKGKAITIINDTLNDSEPTSIFRLSPTIQNTGLISGSINVYLDKVVELYKNIKDQIEGTIESRENAKFDNKGDWEIFGFGDKNTSSNVLQKTTINNTGTIRLTSTGSAVDISEFKAFNNSGKIELSPNTSTLGRNTLTINGNYAADNGSLILNTELKGDDSLTDKLVINGNTSGITNVTVNNVNGTGAQTEKGIELITVSGNSDGEFKQSGRIVAGDYDYTLHRGGYGFGTDAKNWYLTSIYVKPQQPIIPAVPDQPTQPVNPVVRVLIPEIGSYASNTRASNTLFNMRLHDRLGETQYTDALTGEKKVTSMWMRHIGGHNISEVSQGQLKTRENRYITQIGGDLAQWSGNGDDRYHIGAMAGYARQSSKTRNHLSNHYSKGNTTGYSVGLYGTWYQNNTDKSGLYVDSWMLYNWFNNKVSGEGQPTEKYKSRGLTASVETGYTFKLGEYASSTNNLNSFYLQPKAQVTWEGVKAKSHVDRNGVRIESYGDNNIETRLGLRAYINRHSILDNGKSRNFEPFIEANWIHNTHNLGIKRNGKSYDIAGNRNIGEIKAGIEGQINNNLNIWGNVAQQIGKHKYQDTQVMLGIKYMF